MIEKNMLFHLVILYREWYVDETTIRQKLLFTEALSTKEQELLFWSQDTSLLSLDEKEALKSASLKLTLSNKNELEMKNYINKLFLWINKEYFKSLEILYKSGIAKWDPEALKKYTELLRKWKEAKIK